MDSAETVKRNGRRSSRTTAKQDAADKTPPAKEAVEPNKVVELENLVMEKATSTAPKTEAKADMKASGNPEVTALSVQEPASKPAKRPAPQMAISGSIFDRPVAPSEIEVYEEFSVAGLRPIAASHMSIYGTILNGRPIMASDIQVLDVAFPGQRPVFASDVEVRDDLTLPGGRPIVASDVRLLEAEILPGGRPIASNDIDNDMTDFIGYID